MSFKFKVMFCIAVTAAIAVPSLTSTASSAESRSIYTVMDKSSCKATSSETLFVCGGAANIPVWIAAKGDFRSAAFGGKPVDVADFPKFSNAQKFNTTLEWRLQGKKSVAVIQRYFSGAEQYLVVHKVSGKEPSCIVGWIKVRGRPDSNTEARFLADGIAPNFRCGISKTVGISG